jgi:release factor glutamine methyltransferase
MQLPYSNKLLDIYRSMQHELSGIYSAEEIRAMWFLLLEAFFGWSMMKALQRESETLTESEMLRLHYAIKDLKAEKPVQYITGYTWFYDVKIWVEPGVLIPRPETEELVDWILQDARHSDQTFRVLDIGTGSGCIALALATGLSAAQVSAMEVSAEALKIAANNAKQNETDLHLIQADILDEQQWGTEQYDIIVSNPPYVRDSEKSNMKANVLAYEPAQALFVCDEDPLLYYRTILRYGRSHLLPGGTIYFEINEALGGEMKTLVESLGFKDIDLRKDLNGKDRMMKCRK